MDARADNALELEETVNAIGLAMRGLNAQAFTLFGDKVRGGPFTGMIIPEKTPWNDGNASTKLLGTYEHELHEKIEYAQWRRPQVIANVGCAEGFYAVGLARLCPEAQVWAFDLDEASREMCQHYAERNKVTLRVLNGVRRWDELEALPPGRTLFVIDIEGGEIELIDLQKAPCFATSDVIVECHDFMRPEISSVIADRLAITHRVELVRARLPNFEGFAFVHQFPSVLSVMMLAEKRPSPSCWLACWANSRGDQNG